MPVAQPRPAPNPARRQRLLEAGERLFSSIGYRAVTMARIAEEAGFAKATVYAYFADKDDVFRSVAEHVAQRLVSAVASGLDGAGSLSARVTAALTAKTSSSMTLWQARHMRRSCSKPRTAWSALPSTTPTGAFSRSSLRPWLKAPSRGWRPGGWPALACARAAGLRRALTAAQPWSLISKFLLAVCSIAKCVPYLKPPTSCALNIAVIGDVIGYGSPLPAPRSEA